MATRLCTQCGQAIEGDIKFCTNCGAPVLPAEDPQPQQAYNPQPNPQPQYQQPVQQQPIGTKPKSYLVLSILATLLCCLPFGIPAIVFAAKVDSNWNAGRYQEAQDASRKAKTWMLVSVILGALILISYFALIFYGVATMGEDFWEELRRYR
jgi:uncharacterized membrane protein YvbJ